MTRDRVDLKDYVVVSLWFGCNNDCTLCMLAGLRQNLPPIGFDRFREVITAVRRQGRYRNLILSGAEVTTFEELPQYVKFAASLGWFKKIQVQTNGRRLADRAYLQALVDGGVNEFFVSIHGTGAVHDTITRRPGSYHETMQGLRNLAVLNVNVITNTVLTTANCHDLENIMAVLSAERVSEFHLWNFFPMRKTDQNSLVVDLETVVGLIPRLREMLGPVARPLVLKAFPHCLSAVPGVVFDGRFPETVLPAAFWRAFDKSRFGLCVHRHRCADNLCWGLSDAYRSRFGDEQDRLFPLAGPGKESSHEA
ncbi:radical SAM protein [Desulfosudis oleivorans]|uniref:Radical SAM domain protein n=1 Tax=Desulfosudis oleivorans (strain DSM 6200 / JCM 39069 / Hxd3) TaxID=96561 RepID=A8ZUL1_DESOH|nr:radical SAM protein [Desulfosudis oleivorans]ABW66424.1 Radical SAM domain protein [Desulfosudis oleivorans Hxd3]